MAKIDKLIKKLKSKPKNFAFNEAESLLTSLGYRKSSKGRTSGSRVAFIKDGNTIELHKPHPNNELLPYQVNKILNKLEESELI